MAARQQAELLRAEKFCACSSAALTGGEGTPPPPEGDGAPELAAVLVAVHRVEGLKAQL